MTSLRKSHTRVIPTARAVADTKSPSHSAADSHNRGLCELAR